jgi:hypothetical protein
MFRSRYYRKTEELLQSFYECINLSEFTVNLGIISSGGTNI